MAWQTIPMPVRKPTDRELLIAQLRMLNGMSLDEVAEALHLSRKTVDVHIQNLYRKLGVTSGIQMTVRLIQMGWIKVNPAPDAPIMFGTPNARPPEGVMTCPTR